MILRRAHIKNFRSLRDVQVSFDTQTAILGGNGAGKSTILKALDKFYGTSGNVTIEDCFGKDPDLPIEIGLTFTGFDESEREIFGSHISDEELSVVRIFEAKGGKASGRFYGFIKGHEPFVAVRNAENATTKRALYRDLRESDEMKYADLTAVTRADDIEGQLVQWEARHPDECTIVRDDGQFLGFTNVAKGSLSKSTSFVLIPAVRDAALDAVDGRNSPIAQLMELVVKSAIQRRQDIREWQERTSTEYKQLVDPENLTELRGLGDQLTESLKTLYEETAVSLEWRPVADFSVPLPTADVFLEDGGFPSSVERQGNGLQRAFIFTLLQHLARATILSNQATEADVRDTTVGPDGVFPALRAVPERPPLLPGLILAIEEPELYQHPTKQRHFARVLSLLADGTLPGVAAKMQIIFASHSPYFVSVDRFNQVRLARRHPIAEARHKECILRESSLKAVCRMLEIAQAKPTGSYREEDLRARLHILTSELSEGFFADVVVLVEGESDRAALKATAALAGTDLEAMGIAVLQVNGKNNLDRPLAIFKSLEIPVFPIWDCDSVGNTIKDEQANLAILRILGCNDDEIRNVATRASDSYACFENKLEETLKNEVGADEYMEAVRIAKEVFLISRNDDAEKSPAVMKHVLRNLADRGLTSPSLAAILAGIRAMKESSVAN